MIIRQLKEGCVYKIKRSKKEGDYFNAYYMGQFYTKRTVLHMFKSVNGGWTESFTREQLEDTIITEEGEI